MTPDNSSQLGDLKIDKFDGVAVLTINRPEKLNALRKPFWNDLEQVLTMLASDGATRAIVLTGAGSRAFSAGGDIEGFSAEEDPAALRELQIQAMAGFLSIERCGLIVLAAVNGYAFGGGCELVLACDFAIAAETAVFAMPEAALGLLPGFGVIRAPGVIGRPMTKFMVATGEKLSAQRAYEIGLVQKVVPLESLMEEAILIAKRIAASSTGALIMGKRLMNSELSSTLIDYSVEAISILQNSPDRREGTKAFLQRRPPTFRRPKIP